MRATRLAFMHYLEVCSVSCIGLQTYQDHLEGQKHQKQVAEMTGTESRGGLRGAHSLHCGLDAHQVREAYYL